MRRFSPLLQYEGEWQRRSMKFASVPIGTCHFLSFKNTQFTSGGQEKWQTPNNCDDFTRTFWNTSVGQSTFTSSISTPLFMTNGSTLFHFHPFIQIFYTCAVHRIYCITEFVTLFIKPLSVCFWQYFFNFHGCEILSEVQGSQNFPLSQLNVFKKIHERRHLTEVILPHVHLPFDHSGWFVPIGQNQGQKHVRCISFPIFRNRDNNHVLL